MAATRPGWEMEAGAMAGGGRVEDDRLVRGAGRFVADRIPAGALHTAFVRADRAGARLLRVDAVAARAMPGVVAVLTADDLEAAGVRPLPAEKLPRDDGGEPFVRPVPPLASGRLRHVGEPVAAVIAESAAAARDAAEAVVVETADDPEPPQTCFHRAFGDGPATAAALAASAHRVTVAVEAPRLSAAPMEPRACLASQRPDGRLDLLTSTQSPAQLVRPLAAVLGLDPGAVRVHAEDVGGSFGLKSFLVREEAVVAHAARLLGRPVAWVQTRTEQLAGDHQGRGVAGTVTLGLDPELRFTAVEAHFTADSGAFPTGRSLGLVNNIGGLVGPYAIGVAHATVTGRTSPRAPIAPYRGHGRPEATLAIETAIDAAARRLRADPVDLRRRNLIPPEALPHRTALTFTLDSGDFPAVLDRAAALSDAPGAEERRRRAAERGRLFGRALVVCLEAAGGPVRAPRPDRAILAVAADGAVTLAPGVMSTGQGHETTLTRLAAARLGVAAERIAYRHGDSDLVPDGRGNGGSSGLAVTGPAVTAAADALVAAAAARAAARFGVAAERIERDGDLFRLAGTNRAVSLADLAADGDLVGEAVFTPPAATFPNGAHACEVEIDPETGRVEVTRYAAVEDVGTVLSPVLVEGQMHGGILQGIAQALGERMEFDPDGQVLTGSFMDYAVARADTMPAVVDLASHPAPTAVNPLGAKGVGEAGAVGALAATLCAIRDALVPFGAVDLPLPATPAAVWRAIRAGSPAGE